MRRSDDIVVIGNEGNIAIIREDVEEDRLDDCRVLRSDDSEPRCLYGDPLSDRRFMGSSCSTVNRSMSVDEKWWCLVRYAMNTR